MANNRGKDGRSHPWDRAADKVQIEPQLYSDRLKALQREQNRKLQAPSRDPVEVVHEAQRDHIPEHIKALERIELSAEEKRNIKRGRDPEALMYKRKCAKRNAIIYKNWLASGYSDEQRENSGCIKLFCEQWGLSEPEVRQILRDAKYKRHPAEMVADIEVLRQQMVVRCLEENHEAVTEIQRQIDKIREDETKEWIPVEDKGKMGITARHKNYHLIWLHREVARLRKIMAETLVGNYIEKPVERKESASLQMTYKLAQDELKQALNRE